MKATMYAFCGLCLFMAMISGVFSIVSFMAGDIMFGLVNMFLCGFNLVVSSWNLRMALED